jgi:hypothetical protein
MFLTQSKAIHADRQTVTVVWVQRINQKGDVLGTGYFRIQEYMHHKGAGLRKRIMVMAKKGVREGL